MSIILVGGTGAASSVDPAHYTALLGTSHGVEGRILASVNGSAFTILVPTVSGTGKVSFTPGTGVARSLTVQVLAGRDSFLVNPHAVEWRAEYGIRTTTGMTWVPVGTFVPHDVKEVARGIVEVQAKDRWLRVADARFEPAARVTSGDVVSTITSLLTEADHRITVDSSLAPTGHTHPTSLWDKDRDVAIRDLARAIGAQVRFNPLGVAVISPVPSLTDHVFWSISRGRGGVKIAHRAGLTSRRTYNAVVVTGQTPGGDPIYSVARDVDPDSVTRWGGNAGKRPRYLTTDLIRTQAQADAAAAALLAQSTRVARSMSVEALPHPGLDCGLVVDVQLDAETWERHLTGPFDLPLGLGHLTIDLTSPQDAAE